jgi:hypothetical protein
MMRGRLGIPLFMGAIVLAACGCIGESLNSIIPSTIPVISSSFRR